MTCCQVPRVRVFSTKGMVREAPSRAAGAHVRVTVAVVPGGVVGVIPVGGDQFLEHALQVGRRAPGSNSTVVRPLVEDGQKTVSVPFLRPDFFDQAGEFTRDILDIGVAAGTRGKCWVFTGMLHSRYILH